MWQLESLAGFQNYGPCQLHPRPLNLPLQSIAAAFGAGMAPAAPAPDLPVLPVVDASQAQALLEGWALPTGVAPAAAGVDAAAAAAAAAAAFPADTLYVLPPGQAGPMLSQLGALAVGRRVERYWPEEGGWLAGTHAAAHARPCRSARPCRPRALACSACGARLATHNVRALPLPLPLPRCCRRLVGGRRGRV